MSEDLKAQLAEALELQAATSAVLRLMSDNPDDLTLVLDGLLDQAVRLSGADVAALVRIDSGLGIYIAVSHELGKPFIGATWPLSESLGVGEAGGRNEVVRMPDARHIEYPAALHGMPVVGSLVSIPLFIKEHHLVS